LRPHQDCDAFYAAATSALAAIAVQHGSSSPAAAETATLDAATRAAVDQLAGAAEAAAQAARTRVAEDQNQWGDAAVRLTDAMRRRADEVCVGAGPCSLLVVSGSKRAGG